MFKNFISSDKGKIMILKGNEDVQQLIGGTLKTRENIGACDAKPARDFPTLL